MRARHAAGVTRSRRRPRCSRSVCRIASVFDSPFSNETSSASRSTSGFLVLSAMRSHGVSTPAGRGRCWRGRRRCVRRAAWILEETVRHGDRHVVELRAQDLHLSTVGTRRQTAVDVHQLGGEVALGGGDHRTVDVTHLRSMPLCHHCYERVGSVFVASSERQREFGHDRHMIAQLPRSFLLQPQLHASACQLRGREYEVELPSGRRECADVMPRMGRGF